MGWIVRVVLAPTDTDAVSSLLWDLNTTGIAEIDRDRTPGAVELLAGFESETQARAAAGALLARRPGGPATTSVAVERAEPAEWVDRVPPGSIHVGGRRHRFEVGSAFGHGRHPTTALALSLLATALEPGDAVLDFGTGTGVLALAARAAGAGRIVAVDNDPAARAVARANLVPEPGSTPPIVVDRLPSPSSGPAPFDVIAANVLLPVHVEHGPALVELLDRRGSLIVTGVLTDQEGPALAAYRPLRSRHRLVDGDWVGVLLGAPPAADSG